MPSPFPGMNPYLEHPRFWQGFRGRFISAAASAIEAELGPQYFVEIEHTVYVRELPEAPAMFAGRPDVYVGRQPARETDEHSAVRPAPGPAAVAIESPSRVRLPSVDLVREPFIEIRDAAGEEVVAVLELLSPSNKKPGPDRAQHLAKRAAVLYSPAHLVEIDLLRGHGARMPIGGLPQCDYYVMVSRAADRPDAGVWPLGIRQRLPVIPVPLKDGDDPARIDLQALLHEVYDAAGYQKRVYAVEPEPPLSPVDVGWARAILAGAS